jgi:putative CocE/NonD family hydrolase
VIRTPYGAGIPSAIGLAARLIAESGYHVIVQDVRGRYGSEGRFVPFENERTDGADTLRWVVEQPWCTGRIGLFGASYLAYTAWCALAEAPEHVGALVSLIGSGDVYGTFYRGGAFCLSTALEWGVGVGEREGIPARRIDLARGLAHLPVREADRVALKTVDWVRDWIDHPRRDAFWKAIVPELPRTLPPTVSIAGWYDFFLECQLRDHAALEAAARDRGTPPPRLVVGPWAHGLPARLGWWRQGLLGNALREAIAHFDAHLRQGGGAPRKPGVRFFVPGREAWLESASWPPPDAGSRRLFLGVRDDRGVIVDDEPVDPQPPLQFVHDPAHPIPTIGGALFGLKAGIKDQRALTARPDVLEYTSGPLERELTIAGPVRVCVQLETDAEDVDVTARLIDVGPRGRAVNVCDGITRARWRDGSPDELAPKFLEPGRVTPITVELGNTARTFGAGHRLRVVVGASNFPRFDRNPGVRAAPALAGPEAFRTTEQVVHHDARPRSWLEVRVWDPGAQSG